jgi:DNA ligase-1
LLLQEIVRTSAAVAHSSGRLAKIGHLGDLLRRLAPEEVKIAIPFLSGDLRQGRIGLGPATIWSARPSSGAEAATLSLAEVDETFAQIAGTSGAGSTGARQQLLRALLQRATASEQDFLMRLLAGELRQGALESVLLEAVARASGIKSPAIRRAVMNAGALAPVAYAALVEGEPGLAGFTVQIFQPVQPMLASPADTLDHAIDGLNAELSLEWKIDGARIQVHKAGDEVKVFTRNLRDVTAAVPDVVDACRGMAVGEAILDGEVIALRPDGSPHPFQTTMQRFGRRLDVDRLRIELPLTPFFFDLLYVDGESLMDHPQGERMSRLASIASAHVVPGIVRPTREQAARFLAEALERGHEGVMVKTLASGYSAGRRGRAWMKVKVARTLDLVVLAAEWGHGRRKGLLSNLHLGARDPDGGGFVMLGKTFKGLTDEMLGCQTARFLELEAGRDEHTVYLRPEVVVEIAFNELQESPHYPGGLALRFARVKGYRSDKSATEADTIETVRAIHRARQRDQDEKALNSVPRTNHHPPIRLDP